MFPQALRTMLPSYMGLCTVIVKDSSLVAVMLERVQAGEIRLLGEPIGPRTNAIGLRQKVGFVLQSYNLFPHLNVRDNVTLALRYVKGMSRAQADPIAPSTGPTWVVTDARSRCKGRL